MGSQHLKKADAVPKKIHFYRAYINNMLLCAARNYVCGEKYRGIYCILLSVIFGSKCLDFDIKAESRELTVILKFFFHITNKIIGLLSRRCLIFGAIASHYCCCF